MEYLLQSQMFIIDISNLMRHHMPSCHNVSEKILPAHEPPQDLHNHRLLVHNHRRRPRRRGGGGPGRAGGLDRLVLVDIEDAHAEARPREVAVERRRVVPTPPPA